MLPYFKIKLYYYTWFSYFIYKTKSAISLIHFFFIVLCYGSHLHAMAGVMTKQNLQVLVWEPGWKTIFGYNLISVICTFLLRFEHLHSSGRHLGLLKLYLTEYASTAMLKWVWRSPLRTCLPAVTAVVWGKLQCCNVITATRGPCVCKCILDNTKQVCLL